MIDLGWTRNDVLDQVDWPFYEHLEKEWKQFPPIRIMAAAFAGYKPPDAQPKQYMNYEDFKMLMDVTGGRIS